MFSSLRPYLALTLALSAAMWPDTGRAAEQSSESPAASESIAVEVFQAAQPRKSPVGQNTYPISERQNGREGWVRLDMMIDPQGKPYEIAVVDSTGNAVLEQAAVNATAQMSFEPARLGATPIDSSYTQKFRFSLRQDGANSKFIATFRKFIAAVDRGDRGAADEQFAQLKVQTLYEDAFWAYGKYFFDRKWGTEREQLADLERAVAGEKSASYLSKGWFVRALTAKFALEVKFNDYGSALRTWEILKPLATEESRASLQLTADEIVAIRNSDQAVRMSQRIERGTMWGGILFKKRFYVEVKSGAVSEIKLLCQKKYLFFKFDPDVRYSVTGNSGDCSIQVIGDHGTSFDLVQS